MKARYNFTPIESLPCRNNIYASFNTNMNKISYILWKTEERAATHQLLSRPELMVQYI